MKAMLDRTACHLLLGNCVVVLCLSHLGALGQTPANDTCAGAVPLTDGVPYVMSTTNATTVGDGHTCYSGFVKGVWFRYTPGADGLVIVSTCGSAFTTIVEVFTNGCGAPV